MTTTAHLPDGTEGKWLPARHLLHINRKLMDLASGRIKRLMVFCPPRHGKSELCTRHFPAWYLGTFPSRRVMIAGYGAKFASSFGQDTRLMIEDFGELFDVAVSDYSSAKDEWRTAKHKGMLKTAGIGGPLTGLGCNLMIVDDPVKDAEESLSETIREKHWDWWQSTASTRLEPGASVLVIMTRWHPDDLAGRILERQKTKWNVVSLPALALENDPLGRQEGEALWPERWPAEVLNEIKLDNDPYWWRAMYQQQPGRAGKYEWPDEYFQGIWVPDSEWPTSFDHRFMAGDASMGKEAKGGDYQAIVSIGIQDGKVWVDSDIRRRPVSEFCEAFVRMARKTATLDASLEINTFQELLEPEIFRIVQRDKGMPLPLRKVHNAVKKELRIRRLGPYFARGELRFRDTPDNRLLINMAREFSFGDYDDGLDALEMAIRGGIEYLGGHVEDQDVGSNLLEAA